MSTRDFQHASVTFEHVRREIAGDVEGEFGVGKVAWEGEWMG